MIKGLLFASVFCFGPAALSQTMPDAATLFENTAVKDALENNTGATDSLKALRPWQATSSHARATFGRLKVQAPIAKSIARFLWKIFRDIKAVFGARTKRSESRFSNLLSRWCPPTQRPRR